MATEESTAMNKIGGNTFEDEDGVDMQANTKSLEGTSTNKVPNIEKKDIDFLVEKLNMDVMEAKNLLWKNEGNLDKAVEAYIIPSQ